MSLSNESSVFKIYSLPNSLGNVLRSCCVVLEGREIFLLIRRALIRNSVRKLQPGRKRSRLVSIGIGYSVLGEIC
jgi:hypothetical protein